MENIIEILRLKYEAKLSHQKIAGATGLSKGVVGKYVSLASAAGIAGWPLPQGCDQNALEKRLLNQTTKAPSRFIEPDWFVVHQELKRKGVTLLRLWAEHEEKVGVRAHRYTQFSQLYRAWKANQKRSMRQHHRAGEKVFIDHCGPTVDIIDQRTGEVRKAQIYVAVLGASSYTFAEATWTQGLEDWIGSNRRMLEFFGGVPELLVPDNLRSASSKACRYEPVVNATYLEFARHYATAVLPTRPRKPKDKSKAEAGVLLVERWVLAAIRHQEFFSLAELNSSIGELLIVLNERPLQRRTESRKDLFELLDKPMLRSLPPSAYEFAVWRHAKVAPDYHVQFEGSYYSVPHSLVGQKVDLRVADKLLEVLSRGKRVAIHQRDNTQRFHTVVEHMPSSHRRHAQWSPSRFNDWAKSIGVATEQMVQHLLTNRPHPEHGYRSCLGLLSLSKRYGKPRLEAACRCAIRAGAMSVRSVRSILKKGMDKLEPEPREAPRTLPEHENVRGAEYFDQ